MWVRRPPSQASQYVSCLFRPIQCRVIHETLDCRIPYMVMTDFTMIQAEKLESLQSPTSTAWKPTDINQPVLTHRGSNISEASAEYIKQVEDECTIPEEDEDDEEEEKEAVKT